MEIRFNDYLNERLKDEAFRKEYEAVEREEKLKLVRKIIKAKFDKLKKTHKKNKAKFAQAVKII